MDSTEKWISVSETAEYLGVAEVTIYRWLEKGKIPAHRVGKQWRFKPSMLDEWVKSGSASEEPVE